MADETAPCASAEPVGVPYAVVPEAQSEVQDFLKAPPERQLAAKGIHELSRAPLRHGFLYVSGGSVLDFGGGTTWAPGDVAVVNAANAGGLCGGGVDGAFVDAGGKTLAEDRQALPLLESPDAKVRRDRIETGGARATGPNQYGKLHAGTVIHAVGPNYIVLRGRGHALEEGDKQLTSAYAASMALAAARGIRFLGFSLLSAGIFRGPRSLETVLGIAVTAIAQHAYEGLEEVHLVGFQEEELDVLTRCLADLQPTLPAGVEGLPEPHSAAEPAATEADK